MEIQITRVTWTLVVEHVRKSSGCRVVTLALSEDQTIELRSPFNPQGSLDLLEHVAVWVHNVVGGLEAVAQTPGI